MESVSETPTCIEMCSKNRYKVIKHGLSESMHPEGNLWGRKYSQLRFGIDANTHSVCAGFQVAAQSLTVWVGTFVLLQALFDIFHDR